MDSGPTLGGGPGGKIKLKSSYAFYETECLAMHVQVAIIWFEVLNLKLTVYPSADRPSWDYVCGAQQKYRDTFRLLVFPSRPQRIANFPVFGVAKKVTVGT